MRFKKLGRTINLPARLTIRKIFVGFLPVGFLLGLISFLIIKPVFSSQFSFDKENSGFGRLLKKEWPDGDPTPIQIPRFTPTPTPTCTPDCAGKECGDDGCGGSCGTCPSGYHCSTYPATRDTCQRDDYCQDTDGGVNYSRRGTATSCPMAETSPVCYSNTDYCLSSSRLREYYCKGPNVYGNPPYTDHNCSSGEECLNGACVTVSTVCENQYDGEIDPDNPGRVCSGGACQYDYCQNSNQINEQYCEDEYTPAEITLNCSYGCVGDGSPPGSYCAPAPTPTSGPPPTDAPPPRPTATPTFRWKDISKFGYHSW